MKQEPVWSARLTWLALDHAGFEDQAITAWEMFGLFFLLATVAASTATGARSARGN